MAAVDDILNPAPVVIAIVPVRLIPALLFTLYVIVLAVVPNVTVCADEPLNSMVLAVEVPVSVIVPPDWLKVPPTFKVPLLDNPDKSKVPADKVKLPVTFKVPAVVAVDTPKDVVAEDECKKAPVTFTIPPLLAISQILLPETVMFPLIVNVPDETHLNLPVLVACIVRSP